MRSAHFVYFCTFIGLLTGCQHLPLSQQTQWEASDNQGFLVASLGVTTQWPNTGEFVTTTLLLRPIGEDKTIKLKRQPQQWHFQHQDVAGQLISLPLPVGEYQIYQVQFSGSNGTHLVQTHSELDLKFEIQPKTASYLGEFITSSYTTESLRWQKHYPDGSGYLAHGYQEQRDSALFYEHHPHLSEIPFLRHPLGSIWNGLIYTNMRDETPINTTRDNNSES